MSQHDLVSAQTSNLCVTCHAPLNAIAYIVFVKQFVMSLPAISLGDWFSVNGKGGTGVSACTLQMIHTTYVRTKRTNVPTPPAQCLSTAVPRQKPMQGII